MTLPRPHLLKPALLFALLALMLTGCGRRGLPELPPEADARQAVSPKGPELAPYSDAVEPNRRLKRVIPPQEPFFLDPLL